MPKDRPVKNIEFPRQFRHYTAEEDQFILDNIDLPAKILMRTLKRSQKAVSGRRRILMKRESITRPRNWTQYRRARGVLQVNHRSAYIGPESDRGI